MDAASATDAAAAPAAASASATDVPKATFGAFKRRGQKRQKAKAPAAAEEPDEDNGSAVVRKEVKAKPGVQRLSKRPKAGLEEDVFGVQFSAGR